MSRGRFLVAVLVYGGWDGTLYVNEEVKHRRVNPGRTAILAVALLAIIYTLSQVGFQGVISPAKLQAPRTTAPRWSPLPRPWAVALSARLTPSTAA